jgi:hypothetical protein
LTANGLAEVGSAADPTEVSDPWAATDRWCRHGWRRRALRDVVALDGVPA